MLEAGLAGLARWPSYPEGKVGWKWSVESYQRKGDTGEVTRSVDFFTVISVTICVITSGTIAGYCYGIKKPQLYFLVMPLAHFVALSNLLSTFTIGKSGK